MAGVQNPGILRGYRQQYGDIMRFTVRDFEEI
jgi:hypothetical protein